MPALLQLYKSCEVFGITYLRFSILEHILNLRGLFTVFSVKMTVCVFILLFIQRTCVANVMPLLCRLCGVRQVSLATSHVKQLILTSCKVHKSFTFVSWPMGNEGTGRRSIQQAVARLYSTFPSPFLSILSPLLCVIT